jgi:cell division protein FtsL
MKNDIRFYWRQVLRRLPLMLAIIILFTAMAVVQATRCPRSTKPRRGSWWNRRRSPTTSWT